MNILCITHADFESPGVIETWANERGYKFTISRPYKGELLSLKSHYDFLIVMGGPQSPLELDNAPYLEDEIKLIQQAIEHNKLVIGFCLGAQLIGEALGAKTLRSPEKEVGVFPLSLTKEAENDPLMKEFPNSFPVMHWHNDMPGLTESSTLLGYSQGCPRQIVKYKNLVYGFQCHFEITLQGIKTMIKAVPGDLKPSKFTQSAEELLQQDYDAINQTMFKILDRLIILRNEAYDPVKEKASL